MFVNDRGRSWCSMVSVGQCCSALYCVANATGWGFFSWHKCHNTWLACILIYIFLIQNSKILLLYGVLLQALKSLPTSPLPLPQSTSNTHVRATFTRTRDVSLMYSLEADVTIKWLGLAYAEYKHRYYYFELIELTRKLLLAALLGPLLPANDLQVRARACVCVCVWFFMSANFWGQSYLRWLSAFMLIVTLVLGLILRHI